MGILGEVSFLSILKNKFLFNMTGQVSTGQKNMKSYCIPQTRVVYEILNTEVIVVDFSTGNYYALIHIAKQIWELIVQRASLEKIAELLFYRYEIDKNLIFVDVEMFIKELIENGLVEPCEENLSAEQTLSPSDGWEYDAPRLQKYTDVQSLLLLDPIHEVAEVGWPVNRN
jgi:hypothetical protein